MILCKHIIFPQRSLLKRSILPIPVEVYPAGILVFLLVKLIDVELLKVAKSNWKSHLQIQLLPWVTNFSPSLLNLLPSWTIMVFPFFKLHLPAAAIFFFSLLLCSLNSVLKTFAWSFIFMQLTYFYTHCKTLSNSLFPKNVLYYIYNFSACTVLNLLPWIYIVSFLTDFPPPCSTSLFFFFFFVFFFLFSCYLFRFPHTLCVEKGVFRNCE